MMKLGVSSSCLYPEITENAVKYLCENGVENIEIFFNSYCELNGSILNEIKSIVNKNAANVLSVHPFTSGFEPLMLFSDYERRFEDALEFFKHYIGAAQELGAKIIVLHGDRAERNDRDDRYIERYHKLFNMAKKEGVFIAQENVSRCRSRDIDFIKRMKNELGDDVRFVLDLKQARRSEVDYKELINIMDDKLVHIHFNDFDKESDCLLPSKSGECNFSEIFGILKEKNINASGVIEVYRQNYEEYTELIKSLEYLKEIYNKNSALH